MGRTYLVREICKGEEVNEWIKVENVNVADKVSGRSKFERPLCFIFSWRY